MSKVSTILVFIVSLRHRAGVFHSAAASYCRRFAIGTAGLITLLNLGCDSSRLHNHPTIIFLKIPPGVKGGSDSFDQMSGRVVDSPTGARVVAYAHNGSWWVQPFRSRPFTDLGSVGNWSTATHLGTEYAALLVNPEYQPPARMDDLPGVGGAVLAKAVVKGSLGPIVAPKILHFSGYDWAVRSSPENHGGELTNYEPANVWVDEKGFLHMQMGQEEGVWHSAALHLTRSLGYGTYRFVVEDSAHLPPSAVLAMFTRDDAHDADDRTELDVELSRWGKAHNRNADYVIQPYYIPENTIHFEVPAGPITYVIRWEPGSATFRTFLGRSPVPSRKIEEHVFKSGVPVPAAETVRLDFYDFCHSQSGLQHPVDVVVERFEYLP